MTKRGRLAPEVVEFVVEQGTGGSSRAASMFVDDRRVTLRIPTPAASEERLADRVVLLWLSPAEQQVLVDGGDVDATQGLGAVVAPLLIRLTRAEGTGDDGGRRTDRQHVALMVRGLLSAIATERVVSEDFAGLPQQRLAVLAMQTVHSRLEDPELTSGIIAKQLAVSLRTLQATFHRSPASVAEWIRLLRLERTWIDIDTSPRDAPIDVSALGTRWGFTSRDHFARAFERYYGVRPESARDLSQIAVRS